MSTIFKLAESTLDSEPLGDLVETYAVPHSTSTAGWITSLTLDRPRKNIHCLSRPTRFVKRTVDVIVSATMLVLLAPVMLVVAVLVTLTSPGPALFKQVRVGLNQRRAHTDRRKRASRSSDALLPDDQRESAFDRREEFAYGKTFVLYKFRTMCVDAERNGAQFASKADPRVTRLGKFLRKTRLDELPQLWNVLCGQMSLVGPRPERPEFIEQLSQEIPDYLRRLGLKPGLTGVAQVVNGYDNNLESFRRKVAYDLLYLQNCCLWNDFKILFRTIGVVLTGRGAL